MVEFRLRMIEAEVNFPEMDVVIKSLEAMRVLSMFVEPYHTRPEVVQRVKGAIAKGIIQHTGVTIDVYHGETILPLGSSELKEKQHEILLGVEPSQESVTIEELGQLSVRDEPAIETAATLVLTGKSEQSEIFEKVALLQRWAVAHGYKPRGLVRYFHRRSPLQTLNREEFITEVQLAVDTGE
jgi:hypothetical protein